MYGQTGSGKTYTMMGGINNSNNNQLISIASQLSPRRALNDLNHGVSQSVSASNIKDCIGGGPDNIKSNKFLSCSRKIVKRFL